ncbi:MAG TPA: MFS transporter [Candidatus Methanoperedens sp.]|nr:MFS transporter [Candidatus Methanoperedens sp.]
MQQIAAAPTVMNRRQVASWCLFDFANSSYIAVIAAVVFQVFYINRIVGNADGRGDLWWGRAISASMLFVSLSSPFLGGVADYAGVRKRLLGAYTALCVGAVACFACLTPGAAVAGFALIVLANVGMEGGLVFYNSFLPQIAPPERQGRVSGWGFGVGYAGSIASLLIALPLARAGRFEAIWLMVAVFFALFSLPAFRFLPHDVRSALPLTAAGRRGLRNAWVTIREIWARREPRTFLLAYLIYEDGVNTVVVFSSSLAATTFGFDQGELIALYLVVQVTALAGAFALAQPTDTWGPKRVVSLSLLLWAAVSVAAYFVQGKAAFWAVACTAGLGLGSVQAGTRAFFTQFVPPGKEAEYFGVYSLVGKTSAILGPLVFGQVSAAFGSQRPAILSIVLFFAVGFALLARVRGGGPNVGRPARAAATESA